MCGWCARSKRRPSAYSLRQSIVSPLPSATQIYSQSVSQKKNASFEYLRNSTRDDLSSEGGKNRRKRASDFGTWVRLSVRNNSSVIWQISLNTIGCNTSFHSTTSANCSWQRVEERSAVVFVWFFLRLSTPRQCAGCTTWLSEKFEILKIFFYTFCVDFEDFEL